MIETKFPNDHFLVTHSSRNGSYHLAKSLKSGKTILHAVLTGIKVRLTYSLCLAPGGRGLFISGPFFGGGGLIERGLIYSSKKKAMEIISLNCNKLKIITQYISYNNNIYINNITAYNIYGNYNV